mmetsp:Transcript_12121/g.26495  ORF Transcript_12121/g.26495 Transcript_12121/m.26495 type:complete len:110 (-) Transcript_12121:586-915(-)
MSVVSSNELMLWSSAACHRHSRVLLIRAKFAHLQDSHGCLFVLLRLVCAALNVQVHKVATLAVLVFALSNVYLFPCEYSRRSPALLFCIPRAHVLPHSARAFITLFFRN